MDPCFIQFIKKAYRSERAESVGASRCSQKLTRSLPKERIGVENSQARDRFPPPDVGLIGVYADSCEVRIVRCA